MLQTHNYTAEQIKKLEGLDGVRKRPDMYIGDTGEKGLHHCIFEIVDNSVDEALAGYCNNISVVINKDGSCSIEDNGRGIPVDIHPKYKISTIELVMTNLHAGGKFNNDVYKVSGGLHGVGAKCVNALSNLFIVEISRNNKIYKISFSRGKVVDQLKIIGNTNKSGTKITFYPDKEIFTNIIFNYNIIEKRLRELAFLNKNLNIEFIDFIKNKKEVFNYKNGIIDYIKYLNNNKSLLDDEIIFFNDKSNNIDFECALQYNQTFQEKIYSYANSIFNIEGGTHLSGFKSALTRVINIFYKNGNFQKNIQITGEDVREGLTSVISIKLNNPRFEGQTKTRLSNIEIDGIVQKVVNDKLKYFFEKNPVIIKKIITKVINAARSREAAKKAKETIRKTNNLYSFLPGKLAECSQRDPKTSELYIVEGNSAGGSAKQGRDRKYQAIIPIRGKIINSEKSRIEKVLNNNEIKSLITAIGTGIINIDIKPDEHSFNINKIRYNKIIIMSDADVDGLHIQTLLLTFMFKYMRPLIEQGYVYIAQPPLYKIKTKKMEKYINNNEELNDIFLELGGNLINTFMIKNSSNNIIISIPENRFIYILKTIKELIYIKNEFLNHINNFNETFENYLSHYNYNEHSLPKFLMFVNNVKNNKIENIYFHDSLSIHTYLKDKYNIIYTKKIINHIFIEENNYNISLYVLNFCENVKNILKNLYFEFSNNIIFKNNNNLNIYYTLELKNKEIINFNNLLDIINIVAQLGKKDISLQRYKGLGEMNPKQLYETTMNPINRKLIKVMINNLNEANDIFLMLMGENVIKRKIFIEEHAIKSISSI